MRIQTKNIHGKLRKLYIPNRQEKKILKKLIPEIIRYQETADHYHVQHGFAHRKSSVTNALAHSNYQYTISFDFKDFFGSITEKHLRGKLPEDIISQVLFDGAPQQGLPTSPAVSNIAASSFDEAVVELLYRNFKQVQYTRYVDDLTFSTDSIESIKCLGKEIPKIAEEYEFNINHKKTRIQKASSGRRIITGIAVDETIHPTRKSKRKLRAALHQGNTNKAQGLSEWVRCKEPNGLVYFICVNCDSEASGYLGEIVFCPVCHIGFIAKNISEH